MTLSALLLIFGSLLVALGLLCWAPFIRGLERDEPPIPKGPWG